MSHVGPPAFTPAAVSGWGPFFAVHTHHTHDVPRPPWRRMAELVDDPDVLRERVSAVQSYLAGDRAATDVPLRVAASVAQLGLVARLVSPMLAMAVLTGRFPDLDLSGLWWQPELGGAFPLSLADADCDTAERVIGGPVRQLVEATRPFSVPERVLWGNVASAVNGAATMIDLARPDLAARTSLIASAVLDVPFLRLTSERTADGRFRRLSCCLIYRASPTNSRDAICGDCVLRTASR